MKKTILTAMILNIFIQTSCVTLVNQKAPDIIYEPTVKIANKKEGLLHLSIIYNGTRIWKVGKEIGYRDPYETEKPKVNWESAHPKILERCKALGYTSYQRFEDYSSKNCVETDQLGCKKYEMIWECQCK